MSEESKRVEDPPSRLAAELRRLWSAAERRAGAPIKVGAFARDLYISQSSVYAYRDGSTLPQPLVLDRIVLALGGTPEDLRRVADLREAAAEYRQRSRRRRSPETVTSETVTSEPVTSEPLVSPCQLPPDVRHFIGRAEQIAELNALAAEPSAVAMVSGTAGVGKTSLVVHWAHQVRDLFADGVLYVDLRGFDPEQPLEPGHVLGTFLRALGITGDAIPGDLAERTALFRARLDRRKVLIFLDNAASEDQVRPLLPGGPHSFVVVTSRNTLPGLIARDGAYLVPVPSMPIGEAVTLLKRLIGERRVGADQEGAAALVERCARLPLAIRIGADLAATRRRSGLTALAYELHCYHLDLFSAGGDERTAIRTVFSWSYLHLRADRARAFRLLGLHPGHDLDAYTCAALLDVDVAQARLRIDDLVRANLVEEAGDGRYRMHDLLRAYAREQAGRDESDEAMRRLFDHYLGTCATAVELTTPDDAGGRPPITEPDIVYPLATAEEAMAWLDAERRNLLTLAEVAANEDWPVCAIQMSALLCRYLHDRAHYADAMALHTLALKVARNKENAPLEGWELTRIGEVHMRLGHDDEARDHLEGALAIGREVGDQLLEARALRHLGQVDLRQHRAEQALTHLRAALPLTRGRVDPHLEAQVLSHLGLTHDELGSHDDARLCHEAALQVSQRLRDDDLRGRTLNNLGVHHQRADATRAESFHRRAVAIARDAGIPSLEAEALLCLGVALDLQGLTEAAQVSIDNALTIAIAIGDRTIAAAAANRLGPGNPTSQPRREMSSPRA